MWASWLHVMVVHIPVILTPVGIVLLIRAVRSSREGDYKFAYSVILIAALAASTAYFTGPIAADWLNEVIELNPDAVENHGVWGRAAFTVIVLGGAGALLGLIAYLQEEEPHRAVPWVVLGLSVLAFAILVWTAHLGGLLRRPELGL